MLNNNKIINKIKKLKKLRLKLILLKNKIKYNKKKIRKLTTNNSIIY